MTKDSSGAKLLALKAVSSATPHVHRENLGFVFAFINVHSRLKFHNQRSSPSLVIKMVELNETSLNNRELSDKKVELALSAVRLNGLENTTCLR